MKTHRAGINEGFLVKHRLKLTGLTSENAKAILSELDCLSGVDRIMLDPGKGSIEITYDGSQLNIDEVIGIVHRHGVRAGTSWWNRMKLGFDRQIDQNVRDNAGYRPTCCSNGPNGKGHLRD
jgi:hypothetical protein